MSGIRVLKRVLLCGALLPALAAPIRAQAEVELQLGKTVGPFGTSGIQLSWQGGLPEYEVRRATTPQGAYSPDSIVGTTAERAWEEGATGLPVVFYLVSGRANCWNATADAWVDNQVPTTNYGGEDTLEVSSGPLRNAYLQFPVADAVPPGARIVSARLSTYQVGGDPFATIGLRQVTGPWSENAVTYATRPSTGNGYGTTYLEGSTGPREWDLTSLVQEWVDRSSPRFGIELYGWGEADYAILSAREDVAPALCVDWQSPLEEAAQQLRSVSEIPVRISAERGIATFVDARVSGTFAASLTAVNFLDNYGGLFGLDDAANETFLDRLITDEFGRTTFIFGTRHENVGDRIEQIAVHTSPGSFPNFNHYVVGASARLLPAVQKVRKPLQVELTPQNARQIVEEAVTTGAIERRGEPYLEWFDPNLEIEQDLPTRPTWHVAFAVQETPASGWVEWVANVDAESGEILRMHTVEMSADRPGENFKIRSANYTNKGACWDATTVDDPWFDENGSLPQYPGAGGDSFLDGAIASSGTHHVYHYFYDHLGRESWDDGGKKVRAMVDISDPATGGQWGNAYYSRGCNMMGFGDGWSTRDIVAHEFTHGVVRWTAELEYLNQSGALNESFSDYFASIADGDWQIADELFNNQVGVPAIRDMSHPPLYGHPDHWDPALSGDLQGLVQPVTASNASVANDYGGVHTNSGIPNKVFYLLTDGGSHNGLAIAGLGVEKARKLAYDTLLFGLHKRSAFQDARDHMAWRAFFYWSTNNHGFTIQDVCDVINAWSSVGYGNPDGNCDGASDADGGDFDGDGVPNGADNCIAHRNTGQEDLDGDGAGDACDPDTDNDSVANTFDNCIRRANVNQNDSNDDGIGDACDRDGDRVLDVDDNCPFESNPRQQDRDNDGKGDDCDADIDNDGILNGSDNCVYVPNDQADGDNDGAGDACDNCLGLYNPTQANADNDGAGDACDPDDDNDGLLDGDDNCPDEYNPRQIDNDGNGVGMWCDAGELYELQGYAEQVELDIFVQDNDLLNPIRFPIFPCVAGTTCPNMIPERFITEVNIDVSPAYLVRIVDDRGFTMAHAEYDASGSYTLQFPVDHEYAYTAIGSPTYEGRRYYLEMIAADGATTGAVTGTIDVTTTDQTP